MADTRLLTVGCGTDRSRTMPRIRLSGDWLLPLGFDTGAQVVAEYEADSITFTLTSRMKNIYYYPVKQSTGLCAKENNAVMPVYSRRDKPHIEIKGDWLKKMGFTVGSVLVVRCEKGLIQIRKAAPAQLSLREVP